MQSSFVIFFVFMFTFCLSLVQYVASEQLLTTLSDCTLNAKTGTIDLPGVLDTMDYILFQLGGIKSNTLPAPAPEATHPTTRWPGWRTCPQRLHVRGGPASTSGATTGTFVVEVHLCLAKERMPIPLPHVTQEWFVCRAQEREAAVQGLLHEGARVLIHGSSGVGKDVLAGEVVRDTRIANCAGVRYVNPLQCIFRPCYPCL